MQSFRHPAGFTLTSCVAVSVQNNTRITVYFFFAQKQTIECQMISQKVSLAACQRHDTFQGRHLLLSVCLTVPCHQINFAMLSLCAQSIPYPPPSRSNSDETNSSLCKMKTWVLWSLVVVRVFRILVWNSLHADIRHTTFLSKFKTYL